MAAVTHGVSTAVTTNNQASYTSGSFTPSIGDLLVGLVHVRDAVPTDGSVSLASSSPESITFTRISTALKSSSADRLFLFVADALVAASGARTVTFGSGDDASAAGNIIQVARVSGMSRVGSAAVRQSGVQDNGSAAGTPTVSFAGAALTTNPIIAFMGNNTNPAGVTEPGSFTERNDTGFNTPGTGSEYASVNSGFTASSVAWGGTSASAFGAIAAELDASVPSHTASGDLNVAPVTLSATANRTVGASGALALAALTLSADAEIAQATASAAITLTPLTLAASLAVDRTVAGTMTITGPVLAASVDVARSASGALIVPATTLAADVMRTVSSDAALTIAPPVLAAAVSVLRFVDGTLALAVPVLAANVHGEELTVNGALVVPPVVLDADALITRTASGALSLAAPVLSATADRTVDVQGVLILEAPSLEAQAAIARFASGDLTLTEVMLAATSFAGAIQSVIGLRASVTSGDRMSATVTAVRDGATVNAAQKTSTVH